MSTQTAEKQAFKLTYAVGSPTFYETALAELQAAESRGRERGIEEAARRWRTLIDRLLGEVGCSRTSGPARYEACGDNDDPMGPGHWGQGPCPPCALAIEVRDTLAGSADPEGNAPIPFQLNPRRTGASDEQAKEG